MESKEKEFGVNHYAGPVYYDVTAFCEKNKDELLLNIKELLASSSVHYLREWFADVPVAGVSPPPHVFATLFNICSTLSQAKESTTGGKDKVSQASQFRKQLDDLMKTLNATEPHYIRWSA